MKTSGNYFVAFKMRTKSVCSGPRHSIHEALMEGKQGQQGQHLRNQHFPRICQAKAPGKSVNFDYQLFNWLVDLHKTDGLHVDDLSMDRLTKFTCVLRNVPLHAHQKKPLEKSLPERFRHDLVRSGADRKSLSREHVEAHARMLELAMGDASPTFALQRWQSFHNDVMLLQRSLCEYAEKMKKNAEEQHARHRLEFQFSDKLSNCSIVEASADGTEPR